MSYSVAMLSVHTSPLDIPGRSKDAGGMNVYIRELARELGRSQITVDIFTRQAYPNQSPVVQLAPNVRVIHVKAGPVSPISKHDLHHYLPEFRQHIEAFRRREAIHYDLVHSHYWLSGVAAMPLAGRWDIPHITMFHTLGHLKQLANPNEPEPLLRLEMERQLIQHVDRIIASTIDERQQIIRHCGATPGQVEVIPCGVNLELFFPHDRKQAREKLGLKQHTPTLLYVGRLDPFKGPDLLLQTIALMEEEVEALIVGGKLSADKELDRLRELARKLRISQRVHFLGARPQNELPLFYSAADVSVVPSYHESFGLAAVESLACGTPVVATRSGGLMTVVHHGETGYLVQRCPGFFAERLDFLLQHPVLLAQMRAAARPSVIQYSWKHIANQMLDVYEHVTSDAKCLVAQ
ncbi:MAG TPA: glycosyltransferase [Ktedonobacteraceae bacterium]|jgi:D-inositol-3-phosphate glycosyltransferase|nr:glycosyltransferase [Ktedonobacteraceae bacterium]